MPFCSGESGRGKQYTCMLNFLTQWEIRIVNDLYSSGCSVSLLRIISRQSTRLKEIRRLLIIPKTCCSHWWWRGPEHGVVASGDPRVRTSRCPYRWRFPHAPGDIWLKPIYSTLFGWASSDSFSFFLWGWLSDTAARTPHWPGSFKFSTSK
jgi:hypothetical protein